MQELLSEIHALGRQLSMKTAELEAHVHGNLRGRFHSIAQALKKSYSATHQQLQHSLVQLQAWLALMLL